MEKRVTDMLTNTRASMAEDASVAYSRRQLSIRLEQHTKIFASMCPDEILDYYDDYETREYHTTLMLGDISGFTDLTEKFTKTGIGGPSKLSETLNSYIGAMVQEILSHNGDVLKFSGDAFIVMWKLQDGMGMRDIAIEAMQTACIIQKHFGTYDTDIGVTLKVKLAIASGKTYFTSIGDPEIMSYYIITGRPVWDVKFAEGLCRGGDILVAPSCWQWANPNDYIHEKLPDGIHTLIIACSAMWYHARVQDIHNGNEIDQKNAEDFLDKESVDLVAYDADVVNMNMIDDIQEKLNFEQVDYSLRPKVIKVAKAKLKDSLRSYMLRPVIRSVEMDEPLEHLTEMRHVVILFINIITGDIAQEKLITLVNEAYKLVCRIVGEMNGCVNKTSLFDKDLIFLCIFGLRGDKHKLESQIGLRCAIRVRRDLLEMRNIKSVTIGVTTGMTYCGVIGHILRREYTVIGMSVNKAARLMVAYNNKQILDLSSLFHNNVMLILKVICDRESFLRSHLEANHFILQEPRYLKGITNVGPVYEFQEQTKYIASELILSKYPLLGREAEITIFRQLLTDLMEYSTKKKTMQQFARPKYNKLIIKGEPRIGKTRLLDEFAQDIPTTIPCNYISLIMDDAKTSYNLIHLIFSIPLGFNITSTSKERENALISRLGRIREPEFLCALNQLFNVHFRMSASYKALSVEQKRKVLRKLLLKLMRGCFKELWVMIIDDAHYGDNDSMLLFHTISNQDMIFFILSIGQKFNSEYEVHPAVLERAHVIELSNIDKWYHAALACQILDVYGIPPELEKLIQEKSFGNPGWIESYLVSLTQSGVFIIEHIRKKKAEEMGYVVPPITLLKRFVSKNVSVNIKNNKEERSDKWKMYRTSYRNTINGVYTAEGEETIAVCKFAENFVLEEENIEETVDAIILKLFDSLTPLDQLLLKCASVLGEIVNRSMLQYLMEDKSVRKIGLAVQKLFEIRIFGCAMGYFTTSARPLVFYKNVKGPNGSTEIACECVNLVIPDELADLPRYASCGLMRFKMSMFREITYRLLTETQKMELHSKALKYLRRHTRRCIACGELQFTTLLGKTIPQKIKKKRLITKFAETYPIEKAIYIEEEEEVEIKKDMQQQQVREERLPTCFDFFRDINIPLKTFSNVNFSDCKCHLILTTVYTQMLEHCRGIGKQDIILTVILEFVEICLADYNVPQARTLLNDAEVLLQQIFESNADKSIILSYLTAKIMTLQGRCHLESGLLSEANNKLNEVMSSLGYYFPKHKFMINLKSTIQLGLLRWKLSCKKYLKINTAENEHTTEYIKQLANCLAQMYEVFRGTKGMKKHARLAAIWSLNAAFNSSDFFTLCTSFTNMMITAHVFQNKTIISYLEKHALSICARKEDSLEFHELNAIAELYAGVFFSRWLKGEINKAIKIAFITIRMAQTMDSIFLKSLVLPRLAHLLMLACRHSEVVTLLRELEFASQNDLDKSGRTWYYAICADVQLDTGHIILSYRNCEQYYLQEGETIISLQDPEAERRYLTSMWLWCIRTKQWEAITVWSSRNVTDESVVDEHKVAATITALKKLEGLLILYVREVTNRNIKALNTMAKIKNEFRRIEKMIKIVKIAIPRYMLMKAYYYMTQSRKKAAIKMLRQARKLSIKVDNRMIYAWTNHCQQAWQGAMSTIHEDLWKEESVKLDDKWDEINANDSKMIPFTLPLPNYVL